MLYRYDLNAERTIESCGHCYFKDRTMHLERVLPCHDLIYLTEGEWGIGMERQ